ncbi:tetratricopeptide repeat protein [Woeseia oceani]|uniref:TonB C-terminal domain-containing protein n=1 Tax=Woeseia oceani TaxID=1548547 RepID=A0A193LDJ8_9GAMM|nr:tetratricopeptide repeat protein [Woeseia oceani]ANO50605.1 hypothetical protein BA177_04725 [Woeseia oceani]
MSRSLTQVNCYILLSAVLIVAARGSAQSVDDDSYRNAYDGAIAQQSYDEAAVIAKMQLARALDAGNRDALSTATLYSDLASAQRLAGNYSAAQLNYETAVSAIEARTDRMNIALERPLLGLGETLLSDGRPDLALDFFARAVHVRQVNDGPHHIAQVDAIEQLGQAYAVLGDTKKSEAMATRLGVLIERHAATPVIAARELWVRQGGLYRLIDMPGMERAAYARAIEAGAAGEPGWVEPYVRTGESFLSEYLQAYVDASSQDELPDRKLLTDAELALREAIEVAYSDDGLHWQQKYRASLALGDFYSVAGNFSEARQAYSEAWKLLTADPAGLSRRAADLESTTLIWQPPINVDGLVLLEPGRMLDDGWLPDGRIKVSFSVNRRGRLSNIALLEISPDRHPRIEARIKEGLAGYVYRPRMSRGFTVDTAGLTIEFGFSVPSEKATEK